MSYAVSADGQGIARHYDAELSEASAIIGKYIHEGDESRPHFEHSVESIAATKHAKYGGNIDAIAYRVREFLKARCTNEATMYPANEKRSKSGNAYVAPEPVFLDLDGTAERLGRAWALPLPSIYFALLDPERDSLYKRGECEAIAVYFDPAEREDERYITWNGVTESVAKDWDPACYQGIVRTFPSFDSMRQARRELSRALALVRAPAPTDEAEPDVFATNAYLDDDCPEFEGI